MHTTDGWRLQGGGAGVHAEDDASAQSGEEIGHSLVLVCANVLTRSTWFRWLHQHGGVQLFLVARVRIDAPLRWLLAFWGQSFSGFERSFSLSPEVSPEQIVVDASPWRLGAVLEHRRTGAVLEWISDPIMPTDEARFKVKVGDPAGQTIWEALALLCAVRAWAKFLKGQRVQLMVKGDNVGALTLATKMASSIPALNGIGAELALTMEIYDLAETLTAHIPGRLNTRADTLSRIGTPGGPAELPSEFRKIKERKLPARDDKFFVAWDFSVHK